VESVLAAFQERAAGSRGALTVLHSPGVGLERDGSAPPGDDVRIAAAVASARDSDIVIAVVGERETQSGEAKNRAFLGLPGNQQELIDALVATGKPVAVVLLTGRALAVPELVADARALVHAFFPGVEGGHALADVLFGDFNPGGKQPVTWPRSVGQIPIHHYDPPNGRPNIPERGDYKARWLDESDEPLFPFGFGLSYSEFRLEALELPLRIGREDSLVVRARITNLSDRAGDEVAQLYIRPRVANAVTGKRLAAYQRVHLAARESRVVEFRLPAPRLAVLGPDDRWQTMPGTYEVTLGNSASGGLEGTFEIAATARAAARQVAPAARLVFVAP
jgi:beta-glucosidase